MVAHIGNAPMAETWEVPVFTSELMGRKLTRHFMVQFKQLIYNQNLNYLFD